MEAVVRKVFSCLCLNGNRHLARPGSFQLETWILRHFSKQQKIRCVILDPQHEFTCSFEDDEQNSLDRHAHGGHVERLEHDMRHALSVGLEIQRIFREQVVMFPGRKQELVVESVVPDFLHGIPIRDDNRAQWYTSTSRHHVCSASRHHHNSLFDPFRPCCLAF